MPFLTWQLVFLRVLEYYSGILILTTNRVGAFDEAIKSRVHCALYYPTLDDRQSTEIWRMNLDGLKESNDSPDSALRVRFDRNEIEAFAVKHWKNTPEGGRWNGRQIKNAFQTAIALAEWDHFQQTRGQPLPEGPLLKKDHFQTVADASSHVDEYLTKVRGTDQLRAQFSEARRDDIRAEEDRSAKKARKARAARRKKKVRESSTEEETDSEEESEAEGDSSVSGSGSESEEEVPPPKKKKKKKSVKKKSRRE